MASNKLKVQRFRTNDLVPNGGKQFELGRSWCEDFFEIGEEVPETIMTLVFKPLSAREVAFNNKEIELKLADVSTRGDRKAYANAEDGYSQIKSFFINDLKLTPERNSEDYFAIYKAGEENFFLYFIPRLLHDNFIRLFTAANPDVSISKEEIREHKQGSPLQQIFYGAPGTGKSFTINQETTGEDVVRTTFHPDSDYSTFVGAYKPTTVEETVMTVIGTKAVPVENEDGSERKETKIVYEFVEQAFLKAYIKAWLNYAQAEGIGEPKKEYLVIEEINRGNCAQIFGDLFQLLDRNASGYSDYPIQADKDMQKQLQKAFKGVSILQAERINDMYDGKDVVGQVLNGDILLLPNNLYIWATMNTSDQSLFPIDSAFKRRWDWTYVPISDAKKGYTIKVDNAHYDWWQFLEKINHQIGETTNSEDKKLGYFFCKADDNGEISAEKFVGKVIFYLWNDVFKDYEFGDAIFNDEDGSKLTFDKFHVAVGRKSVIQENKVKLFLKNMGVQSDEELAEDDDETSSADAESTGLPRTAKEFAVLFPDGEKVEGSSKFETYFKSLIKIGLDRADKIAAEKKYARRDSPLVSQVEHDGILNDPRFKYAEYEGYYVVKGLNDITQYQFLKLLSNRLNLNLNIIYK